MCVTAAVRRARMTSERCVLALNYRAQFAKLIRSASYGTLVQKIKAKLAREPS
jgi:hypothetical protein